MLAKCGLPLMSPPRDTNSGLSDLVYSGIVSIEPRPKVVREVFGTSIPTSALPGIGASIRTGLAARASSRLLCKPMILPRRTPSAGLKA